MNISLIIPVKNEEASIEALYHSICRQTLQPNEVIIVDGGSTDKTIEIAESFNPENFNLKIIKIPDASPGKGRNIGIENAQNQWIALTDAGIKVEEDWLENLCREVENNPQLDIVYGNFSPVTNSFFDKCAAISYVAPQNKNAIRTKFVASMLLKKKVWASVGGFPDLRAAEDLIFMESVSNKGFQIGFAPKALVHWTLRPNLSSTFSKFILYSKHNIWAGRAWDWHYGVLRQYLVMILCLILAFSHSWWWLVLVFGWIVVRTSKKIYTHRFEYGWKILINPVYFAGVTFLIIMIDMATFIGWGKALLLKENKKLSQLF